MQTATLSSGFVAETADRQEKRRRAIGGAVFSEFIDMFDIYLPTVVLSPVLFYFQPAQLDPERTGDLRIARFYHHPARAPGRGARVRRCGGQFRAANGVHHLGRRFRPHHSYDCVHSRLPPDRHRLLLAPGDLALSRRHLPRRRLHRRSSAGDRIFREGAARLHRRPDPLRLPGGLRSDHPCRDADVRALSPRRDRFTLCAMGVAHPLRHRVAARLRPYVLLHLQSVGIGGLADRHGGETGEDAA